MDANSLPTGGNQSPVLLTLDECAAILRISRRSVERLVSAKRGAPRLFSVKIGGAVRVRRDRLEYMIQARERTS